jgi:hypothetical protein
MGLSYRLSIANLDRTARRVFYYARNVARDVAPQGLFRSRLNGFLARAVTGGAPVRARLDYYNKLSASFAPGPQAATYEGLPSRHSRYDYDLREFARYFDPGLRLDVKYGDLRDTPPVPSIVKSRPIHGDNENSVLFKLDKFRHFHMPADRTPFSRKLSKAVWRGDLNNPVRRQFLDAVHGLDLCDAGSPLPRAPERYRRPFLSINQQRRYRYIVSLEGNDVATNLKWVMSSNSLCLMPPPLCETWFCEGWLEPDVHYAPLAPDFSDLAEKVEYFERNPREAERIIAAAQAYCRRFLDEPTERAISLLVLYKYFVLSGQIEQDPEIWRFVAGDE